MKWTSNRFSSSIENLDEKGLKEGDLKVSDTVARTG